MPDNISSILTDAQVKALRMAYQPSKDTLLASLKGALPTKYSLAGDYVAAVTSIFYEVHPNALSEADRERCIVALLASRDADVNLAIHMYLALMEGVNPSELAHILLLAAVYSGVESFSDGLEVEHSLLTLLARQIANGEPLDGPTILGVLLTEAPPLGIRRY
jgi:alkylhydroperoxidase/carboxymuconolactone decarboxylase family protein YurZ